MEPSEPSVLPPPLAAGPQKDNTLDSPSGGGATQGERTIPLPSGNSSELSGVTLGTYEVVGKLGQGGMGAVYKVRHTRLGKLMALKVLPAHLLREPGALARFEREMRALGKLEHPHLVQAHDAGEINGLHYLTLELMEGGDLSQLVKKRGPLPIWTACRVVRHAALALDYTHRQGLVHRDVKPSNLMLTKGGQLKVSDLGLARLGQDDTAAALTSTGTCMGTPDYMAPEQWEDTHTVDGRADLYALGCTLYFLLHGRAPWQTPQHSTMHSKLKAHVMKDPPDLKGERRDVPEELCAIYHKLMSKAPQDRFASGADLAQALAPLAAKPEEPAATAGVSAASTEHGEKTEALAQHASRIEGPLRPQQDNAPDAALLAAIPARAPVSVTRGGARGKAKGRRTAGAGRGDIPSWLIALGAGGGAALVLLGMIIIKITNKDGTTTEIRVAAGAQVEVIRPEAEPESTPAGATRGAWHGWPADAPAPAIAPFDAAQARRHQAEWAEYLKLPVEREIELPGDVKLAMMLIPPGEFLMGSPDAERDQALEEAKAANHSTGIERIPTEAPRHLVRITQPFYLGKHEVTQAQWEAVMGTNPSFFSKTGTNPDYVARVADMDTSDHPVENVSWNDAAEFCAKLSGLHGRQPFYVREGGTYTTQKGTGYRLPTEAQWEYACRAGTTTAFWSGETEGDMLRTDWISRNSGGRTHRVGELPANPFGLFDVHGNVREWCEDWWDGTYYQWSPTNDPTGSPSGSDRLNRGGLWWFTAWYARSANRVHDPPGRRGDPLGFRLAAVPSSQPSERVIEP